MKKQQRAKLKAAPFPAHWSRILEDLFPLYARLPVEDRKELHGHMQVFLAEKRFEGCGGLEIKEEMKVGIAAQACLLLLHRETAKKATIIECRWPKCHSVLQFSIGVLYQIRPGTRNVAEVVVIPLRLGVERNQLLKNRLRVA